MVEIITAHEAGFIGITLGEVVCTNNYSLITFYVMFRVCTNLLFSGRSSSLGGGGVASLGLGGGGGVGSSSSSMPARSNPSSTERVVITRGSCNFLQRNIYNYKPRTKKKMILTHRDRSQKGENDGGKLEWTACRKVKRK